MLGLYVGMAGLPELHICILIWYCAVLTFVLPFPWLHTASSLMQHRVCLLQQPFVTGHSNCMFGSEPLAEIVAIAVTRLVLRALFSHAVAIVVWFDGWAACMIRKSTQVLPDM